MGRRVSFWVVVGVLFGALMSAPGPNNLSIAHAGTCGGKWRAIDTDGRRSGNALRGIAVKSAERAWVAGDGPTRSGRGLPLIKQWNGESWNQKKVSAPDGNSTYLKGIDAGRRRAVIAVGDTTNRVMKTFAVRRTRSGGWRAIKPVDTSEGLNSLHAVTVLSRKLACAVGTRWDSSSQHDVLIERFNGRRWKVAPVGRTGILDGVFARTRDDVWAVGRTVRNNHPVTLTLRFNGNRWKRVPSPNASDKINYLYAVSASRRNNAWAVEEYGGNGKPLAMHWNGERWRTPRPWAPYPECSLRSLRHRRRGGRRRTFRFASSSGSGSRPYLEEQPMDAP